MLSVSNIDPNTIFNGQCTLPPMPEVVSRVQEILQDDHVDIDEVAELLNGEPALVGKVLKIVNSACYSLQRKIVDVRFAIGFLGLDEIHGIMVSFSVANAINIKDKTELRQLWFHAFHTALCARFLHKKYGAQKPPKELWTAALLHDIGKLVYLKFFPKDFMAIKNYAEEKGCLFSTAEFELVVPSSAFLGTLLCDYWKLPKPVRSACQSHTLESLRDVSLGTFENIFGFISACNVLSNLANNTISDDVREEMITVTKQAFGYDQAKHDSLMADVEDLKADAEAFMQHIC